MKVYLWTLNMFTLARFHLGFENVFVVNNSWHWNSLVVSCINFSYPLWASQVLVFLISSRSWHALHTFTIDAPLYIIYAFTKFTDQQCSCKNSSGALIILTHTAIQIVYCHYMLTPFQEYLWCVKVWHLCLKQEDKSIE